MQLTTYMQQLWINGSLNTDSRSPSWAEDVFITPAPLKEPLVELRTLLTWLEKAYVVWS